MSKIKVTNIELTIDDDVIKLSIDQARELLSELSKLFTDKNDDMLDALRRLADRPVSRPIIIERERYPYYRPYNPIWIREEPTTDPYPIITWCCNVDSLSS